MFMVVQSLFYLCIFVFFCFLSIVFILIAMYIFFVLLELLASFAGAKVSQMNLHQFLFTLS